MKVLGTQYRSVSFLSCLGMRGRESEMLVVEGGKSCSGVVE